MPEYLSPGVYVEEIDTGNKPIEGVSTSTAGFLGVTERGPVDIPMLVTSYGEYVRLFGEKLPQDLFVNANGPHCFLPHAVEGFFTNGGKRMYVTRVLDTAGAQYAEFELHDRGTSASVFTMLLRNAAEGTGTVASGVPLYVVSPNLAGGAVLATGKDIRLGDGSAAEYRTVDTVGGTQTHVVLDFPLSRTHVPPAAGSVDSIGAVAIGGTFTLGADTRIGDTAITLNGAPGDITALGANNLLELAIHPPALAITAEYRFIRTVTLLSAGVARVLLDSPLQMEHGLGATTVTRLDPAAPGTNATLSMGASAGDRVVFLNPPVPAAYLEDTILIFSRADNLMREARRIGALYSLQVEAGAYGVYPAGSLVEVVAMADEARQVATPLPALTLNDQSLLAPGVTLLMGALATLETVTIQSIDPITNQITLVAAPAFGHPAGDPVVPGFSLKQLTAPAAAGATVIAVDNRQTLAVGDVIRIGNPTTEEFATIAALPNGSAIPPDAGIVVLAGPLNFSHAGQTTTTSGATVRRQTPPIVNPAKPPSTLVFPTDNASEMLIVSHGTNYLANDHVRITTTTGEVEYHQIMTAPNLLNPEPITVTRATEGRYVAGSDVAQRNPLAIVEAIDAGMWGNRLRVSAEDEPTGLVARTTLAFVNGTAQIRLASAAGVESGTIIELLDPANDRDAVIDTPLKVEFVDRTANYLINLAAPGLTATQQAAIAAATSPLGVRLREFRLTAWLLHQPDVARPKRDEIVIDSEIFRNLSMDPRHSRYFQRIIGDINGPLRLEDRRPEGESAYIRVHDLAQDMLEPLRTQTLDSIRLGPEALIDILPTGRIRAARHPLEGGDDSVPSLDDAIYIGADNVQPELRTGLWTLVNVDDISIIGCPGRTSATMQGAMIDQCERLRYRFAVLDGPPPPDDSMNDVQIQRQQYDTKYAALYYPWVLITDPFPANLSNIGNLALPPSGHVAGVYARVDNERGVHKAPANEIVSGIIGLQRIINAGEQDILNPFPVNINVIRDFRHNNRGIRIWGARVISSDPDYKYVNVRRLLIFIEKSLDQGLQWVVFEPNAEPLWARVVRSISNFLTVVWRNGALEGTKREEAFFVKCDRTTMTQTDIDNGRLICVIGVAPVKPAEFVIIRIGLWTANNTD